MPEENSDGSTRVEGAHASPEHVANEASPGNSDDESGLSDNDAVLITRNSNALSDSSEHEVDRNVPNRPKKRVNTISDSGSDVDSQDKHEGKAETPVQRTSDQSSDEAATKHVPSKSRIRKWNSSGSDSDGLQSGPPKLVFPVMECDAKQYQHSISSTGVEKPAFTHSDSSSSASESSTPKYTDQKARIKEKRDKLQQKFKSLVTSRAAENKPAKSKDKQSGSEGENAETNSNDSSNDEAASIERIKQKIKERTIHLKTTIYDPDTSSDDERAVPKQTQKPRKRQKSTKPTSPKPMRMSAKQAMDNMQKIKSESNRMLREKEVSLPYHRPKALSLKDIMSRRRPAVAADGKALPIKMNEEQLRLYAQSLEQRQKEMMELCKSDTEDEYAEGNENDGIDNKDKSVHDVDNEMESEVKMISQNDTLYDTLAQEMNESVISNDKNIDHEVSENKEESGNVLSNQMKSDGDINDEAVPDHMKDDATEFADKPVNEDSLSNSKNNLVTIPDASTKHSITDPDDGTENEMHLVYNDSVEKMDTGIDNSNVNEDEVPKPKTDTETDSQLISLHYDTEKLDSNTEQEAYNQDMEHINKETDTVQSGKSEFSDDDLDMEDIDKLIENAEIIGSQTKEETFDSPMLVRDTKPKMNPRLTGAPGMIIDLDGTDPTAHRKLTGVELLKERFTYFAKLKTPEEMEREREKRLKPGTQHQKLKLELENEIAEQRSLEWAKRLEEEKQQKEDINSKKEGSNAEDDIDQIEAKLEDNGADIEESSGESEPEENDCEIKDKPEKRNPMIADEAEESDCDDDDAKQSDREYKQDNDDEENEGDDEKDQSDEESSEEDSESEEEQENPSKTKKGRILKAFEDSDEEIEKQQKDKELTSNNESENTNVQSNNFNDVNPTSNNKPSPVSKSTQDDDLQLAQEIKSQSEDIFASQQGSVGGNESQVRENVISSEDKDLSTQTFSILGSVTKQVDFEFPDKLTILHDTQSFSQEGNLDAVVGMCSGSFSQSLAITATQCPTSQLPVSQIIGDDVLALCTGKFYDNPFVSQINDGVINKGLPEKQMDVNNGLEGPPFVDKDQMRMDMDEEEEENQDPNDKASIPNETTEKQDPNKSEEMDELTNLKDTRPITESMEINKSVETPKQNIKDDILESILDELNEPARAPNKYFLGNVDNKENKQNEANKKKFTIDSDDDEAGNSEGTKPTKKKSKKKKLEKRALQISDDESDQSVGEDIEEEDDVSDLEDDQERLVEYDSEENEVEILPQYSTKNAKKQRAPDFFEQEAELTSEDEWIGSGDEDEAGLDRMEREEGDDDTFNQNRLQRELGQIHMRDVLDQDKREVRMIQELLFEDGDLGAGSRQRKFRWKNADGEEDTGTAVDALPDTQEEEFESEEQWRKERHEREMFLKALKDQDVTDEALNISIDRTSMIKANLGSKSTSYIQEFNTSIITETDVTVVETNTAKDVPSPKKSAFTFVKQSYHGSLLTRGQGALARLAALATPLAAAEEDAPKTSLGHTSKRNFVFATLTQETTEPKVTKRKAETNAGTPRLVKKLRTEEAPKYAKSSLLDHMKV